MSAGDVQVRWARAVVDAFIAAGGTDVVLSPGSRSTPLVFALGGTDLRVTTVIDERSASFLALGQARASGRPSMLVCTSGSAGAHWLPAFVEAREAGVPLVGVTADRPPELHDVGASQTTAQGRLLASHAAHEVSLGAAVDDDRAFRAARSRVARAIAIAIDTRGPVHINVAFRKPFEPSTAASSREDRSSAPVGTPPVRVPAPAGIARAQSAISDARCGVVVIGPVGPSGASAELAEAVRELCARTGFALLAETTSGMRDGVSETMSGATFLRANGFDHLFRNPEFRRKSQVDVVVRIGRSPVSKWYGEWCHEHHDHTHHIVVADHGWHDAERACDEMIVADLILTVRALADGLAPRDSPDAGPAWTKADGAVWDAVLATALDDGDLMTAGSLVRTLGASLPDGGLLFVGNSLTVRDLDWFCAALPEHVGVLSQRGAAGIDGMIAGTLGVASCNRGRPTTSIFGDVAFAHDVGSLQLAAGANSGPVVLLVVDNGGGRIFDLLPIATHPDADSLMARFRTPPGMTIADVARSFGVRVATPTTASDLGAALTEAWNTDGVTVVHARIGGDSAWHRAAFARVDAALDASLAVAR